MLRPSPRALALAACQAFEWTHFRLLENSAAPSLGAAPLGGVSVEDFAFFKGGSLAAFLGAVGGAALLAFLEVAEPFAAGGALGALWKGIFLAQGFKIGSRDSNCPRSLSRPLQPAKAFDDSPATYVEDFFCDIIVSH